jgi:uncharacterized protein (DUF433 family)/predicted nucleotidyltransferase
MNVKKYDRITANPQVMVGKPVIKGTRIPVEQILRHLADGISVDEIIDAHPRLTREDIYAAIEYAANAVERVGAEEARKQPISLEELRQNYRDAILEIARKRKATNVRVFGSVVRGHATSESDVDFLVDFEPGYSLLDHAGLVGDLRELLGREVDVVSAKHIRDKLKNSILKDATPL